MITHLLQEARKLLEERGAAAGSEVSAFVRDSIRRFDGVFGGFRFRRITLQGLWSLAEPNGKALH